MKNYNKFSLRNLNKKHLLITSIVILMIIFTIIIISLYVANETFRNFLDINLFKKNISSNNSSTINFDDNESTYVFAYDKYIAILNKNTISAYNSSGSKDFDLNVNLSNPISSSCNRFLCLGEKDGQKLYLINGQNISWQKDVEGNISRVCVNKNGYVSVIITGTSYKFVIITYDSSGKELFKTYLSTTLALDTSISSDNKYLSIAEIDYSGTSIQSNVKILSIDKSQNDPTNAVDYIYPASSNSIVTSIKYGSKNRLICMYNDSIHIINDYNDTCLSSLSDKENLFADINLTDSFIKISENSNGLFSEVEAHLVDITNNKESIYTISGTPKSIFCNDNIIAINLGSEIHFINTSGWLVKKFTSSQEAKDIVMASGIAGIIYKNKIEIINL